MPTWAMDMPPVEGESSTIPFQILRVWPRRRVKSGSFSGLILLILSIP